jgi:hypothetical protein
MNKFPKMGAALGKKDFNWLLEDDEDVAHALEEEMAAGADAEDIARYCKDQLGETRPGGVNRIRSAARYLQGLKK